MKMQLLKRGCNKIEEEEQQQKPSTATDNLQGECINE